MKKCHRIRIMTKDYTHFEEIRYHNNVLYRQNRSKDIILSLDDFINRLNNTKKTAKEKKHILVHDIVDIKTKWNESIIKDGMK